MEIFDLGIAWNWEFDKEFVFGIERECVRRGLSAYRISHDHLAESIRRLNCGELRFGTFLDRAADDEAFLPVAKSVMRSEAHVINPFASVEHAIDKATMHLEFITNGLQVPYTIIISPYNKKKEIELSLSELAKLGRPFIIKPANTTGGGTGVVLGAESLKDVIETRQHHKNDKYLLQETVKPEHLEGKKAWFRVLFAFGEILPCWWDDVTHIYRRVTADETERYNLAALYGGMKTIQKVCNLDFFSSEIALTEEKKFVVVDYVNEVCDMRSQSVHHDGVPDDVVQRIQELIALEAEKNRVR